MQELPPSEFRFGNYGAEIPFQVYMCDSKLLLWMQSECAVGYCRSPEYRAIPDHVAVMFERDFGRYWSHIPDRVFNRFMGDT
jgi:hypothetical protein